MTGVRITLHGESWIALETLAETFACEVSLVHEVYELGLLGPGERVDRVLFVRTTVFDRLATIVRLHVHQGFALAAVEALLELEE